MSDMIENKEDDNKEKVVFKECLSCIVGKFQNSNFCDVVNKRCSIILTILYLIFLVRWPNSMYAHLHMGNMLKIELFILGMVLILISGVISFIINTEYLLDKSIETEGKNQFTWIGWIVFEIIGAATMIHLTSARIGYCILLMIFLHTFLVYRRDKRYAQWMISGFLSVLCLSGIVLATFQLEKKLDIERQFISSHNYLIEGADSTSKVKDIIKNEKLTSEQQMIVEEALAQYIRTQKIHIMKNHYRLFISIDGEEIKAMNLLEDNIIYDSNKPTTLRVYKWIPKENVSSLIAQGQGEFARVAGLEFNYSEN